MREISIKCPYDEGKFDAINGYANADFIFDGTQAHNDYMLGFRAGIAERQQNERRARSPKMQIQADMFGGGDLRWN